MPPKLNVHNFTAEARQRLQKPARRGVFRPLDAARRQLALLTAADKLGQARIYWLIDLKTKTVEDARFMAFGSLASHPACDAFNELAMGKSLEHAISIGKADILAMLGSKEAFGEDADSGKLIDFIEDLQEQAAAAENDLHVLPKPVEVERYQRKREQDWTEEDKQWLPLSLLRKVGKIQGIIEAHLETRGIEYEWELEGVNDDFIVIISFEDAPDEERPLICGFIQEALRAQLHPDLRVEEQE